MKSHSLAHPLTILRQELGGGQICPNGGQCYRLMWARGTKNLCYTTAPPGATREFFNGTNFGGLTYEEVFAPILEASIERQKLWDNYTATLQVRDEFVDNLEMLRWSEPDAIARHPESTKGPWTDFVNGMAEIYGRTKPQIPFPAEMNHRPTAEVQNSPISLPEWPVCDYTEWARGKTAPDIAKGCWNLETPSCDFVRWLP